MILIESREGLLFRGPDLMSPTEVWDYSRKIWAPFNPEREPIFDGWASEVGAERAETLKFENPSAAHYLYYDRGPWVPSRKSD